MSEACALRCRRRCRRSLEPSDSDSSDDDEDDDDESVSKRASYFFAATGAPAIGVAAAVPASGFAAAWVAWLGLSSTDARGCERDAEDLRSSDAYASETSAPSEAIVMICQQIEQDRESTLMFETSAR